MFGLHPISAAPLADTGFQGPKDFTTLASIGVSLSVNPPVFSTLGTFILASVSATTGVSSPTTVRDASTILSGLFSTTSTSSIIASVSIDLAFNSVAGLFSTNSTTAQGKATTTLTTQVSNTSAGTTSVSSKVNKIIPSIASVIANIVPTISVPVELSLGNINATLAQRVPTVTGETFNFAEIASNFDRSRAVVILPFPVGNRTVVVRAENRTVVIPPVNRNNVVYITN